MLLVLLYVFAALALGGYTTYLLATGLPQALLDHASRHGRFAGPHAGTPSADADTNPGLTADALAQMPSQPVSDHPASHY